MDFPDSNLFKVYNPLCKSPRKIMYYKQVVMDLYLVDT